jgi:hypothetical protein
VRRKLPSGVVAGSAGYQSKSNPSHLRLPHGKSHFTSASKGGWPRSPNSLRRINESGKPQSGPPLNDYFKEDWKGRGYETGASVARSRVFVITGLALAQCLETLFLRKTLDCEKSSLHINTYTISMHSLRSTSFLSPPFVPSFSAQPPTYESCYESLICSDQKGDINLRILDHYSISI